MNRLGGVAVGKFNFRFDRVLDYKKAIEGDKKNYYGTLKQKLNEEEDKLQCFYQYKDVLKKEKDDESNSTSIGNLKLYNNYMNTVETLIVQQKEIVNTTEDKVELAKDELIEATKEKKMYEKLKENSYEQYTYNLKKSEEKLVDNIVSYKTSTQNQR